MHGFKMPGAGRRAFAAIPELDGDAIDVVVRHALTDVVAKPSSRAGGWPPFLGVALAIRSVSKAFSDSVCRSNVLKAAIRRRLWACLGASEAMRLLLALPHDLRAVARTHPLIISTLGGFVPNTRRFAVFAFNNRYWDLLGWALARDHAVIRLCVKHRLKRVKIPRGVADCDHEAFMNFEKLEHVEIGGVESIGRAAFRGCHALKTLKLGEGLVHINLLAFSACASLCEVQLPSTTRMVGAYSFGGCAQLTEVVLNEGLESILTGAFGRGNRIQRLVIPATVDQLGEGILRQRADIVMLGRPTRVHAHAFHPDSTVSFPHGREVQTMRWRDSAAAFTFLDSF
jgi:hypothetical protein